MITHPAPLDGAGLVRTGAELAEGAHARYRRARVLLVGHSSTSQFARYAFVGAVTSALYAVVFVALDGIGDLSANVVGMVASTVVANEMHRRLTFQAAGRIGWLTAQVESGTLAVLALGTSTIAVAATNRVVPDAPWPFEVGLVLAVTGALGIAKFFALRGWVFGASDPT
ncbi:MAG: GtrA family protein [Mycobacteriaceae bacterium]